MQKQSNLTSLLLRQASEAARYDCSGHQISAVSRRAWRWDPPKQVRGAPGGAVASVALLTQWRTPCGRLI